MPLPTTISDHDLEILVFAISRSEKIHETNNNMRRH